MPGMPGGKPAGVPCINLDEERRCRLFGLPERPRVCVDLAFDPGLCADDPGAAHARWGALEAATTPDRARGGDRPVSRRELPVRSS